MTTNILLLTVDNHMTFMQDESTKDSFQIDISPVEGREYDYCFVYEAVKHTTDFKVKEGNTIFIPGEPENIKGFGSKFIRQFDSMMSFRKDLTQIPSKSTLCLTPWRVGLDEDLERSGSPRVIRTPKEIRERPITKTKFMSMIVSDKTGSPLQRARLKLAKVLSEQYPGLVDLYGRGHNPIKDKAEALDDYLFSIGIENATLPGYVTEKFTDCLVTATVPLYAGCPNLSRWYGEAAYIKIDPYDIEETIKFIIELSKNPVEIYKQMQPSLLHARERLLNENNIISQIIHRTRQPGPVKQVIEKTLVPDEVGYFW